MNKGANKIQIQAEKARVEERCKTRNYVSRRAEEYIQKHIGFKPNKHFIESLMIYLCKIHGIKVCREDYRVLPLAYLKIDENFDMFVSDIQSLKVKCVRPSLKTNPSIYLEVLFNSEKMNVKKDGTFRPNEPYERSKKRSDREVVKKLNVSTGTADDPPLFQDAQFDSFSNEDTFVQNENIFFFEQDFIFDEM